MKLATRSMQQTRLLLQADCKALKELLEKVNMDDISDAQVAEINAGKRETDAECTEAVC